jgi:hypothetical protein
VAQLIRQIIFEHLYLPFPLRLIRVLLGQYRLVRLELCPLGLLGQCLLGLMVRGAQKQAQQHRQAGYTNQPTLHIGKKGKHLLVATMLNQESVLMVEYLALGQNSSSNKVIRFQALKHGLEV